MRCYCCNIDHDSVKKVKDVFLCHKCRDSIRDTIATTVHWTFEEYGQLVYTTRQDNLLWRGEGSRKPPKPTLKQPDFDLSKESKE